MREKRLVDANHFEQVLKNIAYTMKKLANCWAAISRRCKRLASFYTWECTILGFRIGAATGTMAATLACST